MMNTRALCLLLLAGLAGCAGEIGDDDEPIDSTSSAVASHKSTLSVSITGGTGRVVSYPAGIDCPGNCSARFYGDKPVTLTAQGNNGVGGTAYRFNRWTSGQCLGSGDRRCQVYVSSDQSVVASFSEFTQHLAFVTSATFSAAQGGRTGFDARCNELASAAGINNAAGNAYIAWLSEADPVLGWATGSGAIERLATHGFTRVDGAPFVDDKPGDPSGLPTTFYSSLSIDENGTAQVGKETFSCTNGYTGTFKTYDNCCLNWTGTTLATTLGLTTPSNPYFWCDNNANEYCNVARRVYCFMNVDP